MIIGRWLFGWTNWYGFTQCTPNRILNTGMRRDFIVMRYGKTVLHRVLRSQFKSDVVQP